MHWKPEYWCLFYGVFRNWCPEGYPQCTSFSVESARLNNKFVSPWFPRIASLSLPNMALAKLQPTEAQKPSFSGISKIISALYGEGNKYMSSLIITSGLLYFTRLPTSLLQASMSFSNPPGFCGSIPKMEDIKFLSVSLLHSFLHQSISKISLVCFLWVFLVKCKGTVAIFRSLWKTLHRPNSYLSRKLSCTVAATVLCLLWWNNSQIAG